MLDAPVLPSEYRPDVAADALAGLAGAPQKTLPSKLFYDTAGVRLFEAITQLPEYYLTRAETALLGQIAPDLAALAPPASALVEYGASDEAKASLLLRAPTADFVAYVPVDVAQGALDSLSSRLRRSMPGLAVYPLCADFTQDAVLPLAVRPCAKFGFFPGSTIGNLDPVAARGFLGRARCTLGDGAWLVVGIDPVDDPTRLLPAYDDASGVTAALNLNLLHRLNREAAADFVPDRFEHLAIWNASKSRIEMHLSSRVAQRVRVAGTEWCFAAGETIHTENSHKYGVAAFRALASASGWTPAHVWLHPEGLFSIHALRAVAGD